MEYKVKQKIDLLLFDLDGTLVDSKIDIVNSANYLRRISGYKELDTHTIIGYVGDGLPLLIERLLPDFTKDQLSQSIKIFQEYYHQHCMEHTKAYPGVLETLEFFHFLPKVVVSNKPYYPCCLILEELELTKHFVKILGGDSMSKKKPDPMPLLAALKELGVAGSQAVMVGDGTVDIKAGKNAGTLTCAVTYGMRSRQELAPLKPDHIIDHFSKLQTLFH